MITAGTQMSLNSYQDQWGRYHDKPTDGINPSSNNGWIYTAYAAKAGLSINIDQLILCRMLCLRKTEQGMFYYVRNPWKDLPPLSRDEVLGMVSLGVLPSRHLNNWSFSPVDLPKFSVVQLIKQLWQLKPDLVKWKLVFKHRNYYWQNNLDQIYRFAYSVPMQDRSFVLDCYKQFKWYKPSHLFYRAIAKVDSIFGGSSGIRYLKYDKSYKAMVDEFPEDHPIRSVG